MGPLGEIVFKEVIKENEVAREAPIPQDYVL